MNRDPGDQDSEVLKILDDIERLKSSEFSQDAVADILKAFARQMLSFPSDGVSSRGRVVSNDAIQAYMGGAGSGQSRSRIENLRSPSPQRLAPPPPESGPCESKEIAYRGANQEKEDASPWPCVSPDQSAGGWAGRHAPESNTCREGPSPSPRPTSGSVTPAPAESDDEQEQDAAEITAPSPEAAATAELPVPSTTSSATPKQTTGYRPQDVLFGRGGLSNHHSGNKRYREEVDRQKPVYRRADTTKRQKTEIRNRLVDTVLGYGGRFLKYDEDGAAGEGGWVEVTIQQARRKTSQALREEKRKGPR